MSQTKICPECVSEIHADAKVCPQCSTRIEGAVCGGCLLKSPLEASLCQGCGTKIAEDSNAAVDLETFEVMSEMLPTFIRNASLFPQSAEFSADKIVITTPYLFGLARNREEVRWDKVAGFQHHEGLIWDHISIETRGQSNNFISNLSKDNAKKIAQALRQMHQ